MDRQRDSSGMAQEHGSSAEALRGESGAAGVHSAATGGLELRADGHQPGGLMLSRGAPARDLNFHESLWQKGPPFLRAGRFPTQPGLGDVPLDEIMPTPLYRAPKARAKQTDDYVWPTVKVWGPLREVYFPTATEPSEHHRGASNHGRSRRRLWRTARTSGRATGEGVVLAESDQDLGQDLGMEVVPGQTQKDHADAHRQSHGDIVQDDTKRRPWQKPEEVCRPQERCPRTILT